MSPTSALADVPKDLKSAAESADGVIVGLVAGFGSGPFPHVEVWVLDVLKGPDPGEKLAVTLPPGTDTMKTLKKHGDKYIIAYRGPRDEKGRYAYAGPRFDTPEIIATPENADKVKPGSLTAELPSFERAIKRADVIAVANITSYNSDKELNKLYYRVADILKGAWARKDITVTLQGRYLHWLTEGDIRANAAPMLAHDPKILCLKACPPQAGKRATSLYYAGPEFTSPYFLATQANIAEVRRLLAAAGRSSTALLSTDQKGEQESRRAALRADWTWWIVGAAAALVALIGALLVSKIDYKYDRRRERLEKIRRGAGADSDTESGKPEK